MASFIDEVERHIYPGSFMESLGIRLMEVDEQHLRAEVALRPDMRQASGVGIFHGGVLITLADVSATAFCYHAVSPTAEPDVRPPVTMQLNVNLVRNTDRGMATAEARWVHKGRTTLVVETRVSDDEGRLLLMATSTHFITPRS